MSKTTDKWFAEAQEEIIKDQQADEEMSDARTWNPDDGDLLRGEFIKAVPYWKEYDGKQHMHFRAYIKDYDTKDKELVLVFVSRSVLKNEMMDSAPKPGSLLVIQYFGKVEPEKGGNSYFAYKVRTEESDHRYWKELVKTALENRPIPEPQSIEDLGPSADPF